MATDGRPVIVVLHEVVEASVRHGVSPALLSTLVDRAASEGWRFVTASVAMKEAEKEERTIALTFDDAYRSVVESALPILVARSIPATVFVSTEFVGQDNAWNRRAPRRVQHCGWPELARLAEAGWEVGSHGHGHYNLLALTEEEVLLDLDRSMGELRRQLGLQPSGFAYPYGAFDSRVRGLVRRRFDWAMATEHGRTVDEDRLAVRRIWPGFPEEPLARWSRTLA